jgi:hypothetical protein
LLHFTLFAVSRSPIISSLISPPATFTAPGTPDTTKIPLPPTPLPPLIELSENQTTVTSSRTDPVTLRGRGRLVGRLSEPFNFTDVTIGPDSEIAADGLTVVRRLHMIGPSVLLGVSGDWVSVATGAEVILTAQGRILPRINLGSVGRLYSTQPSRVVVEVKEDEFSESELSTLHIELITGRTLAGCERWINVASVSPESHRLSFACEPPNDASVDESGMRAVVLQGEPWNPQTSQNWTVIIVAVAAVLVVGGVVIGICVWRRSPSKKGLVIESLDPRTYTESRGSA